VLACYSGIYYSYRALPQHPPYHLRRYECRHRRSGANGVVRDRWQPHDAMPVCDSATVLDDPVRREAFALVPV
jgi:hypothetical protein